MFIYNKTITMSLAANKLQAYGLLDPVVMQQAPIYPVVSGARAVSYQITAASSISDASTGGQLYFDVNPAHENVYVDRRIYLRLPVRMKIDIPTGTLGCQNTRAIIQAGAFGLRSFPAQKAMDTMVLNINGLPVSVEIGKTMSALELFNISARMREIDFSKCCTYPLNKSTQFSNLAVLGITSARNPLACLPASAGTVIGGQYTVVLNADTASTGGSCWVDFVTVEPLYISPLYFGPIQDDQSAFLGVNSMSLQFNFASGGGNRMIAIDARGSAEPLFDTEAHARAAQVNCTMYFQNFTAGTEEAWSYPLITQPALLVKQLAPSEIDENLKMKIKNYPFTQTRVFVTSIGSKDAAGSGTVESNNMQLSSVPSRVYAYVRPKDSVLRTNPFSPDCFAQINACRVQWGVDNALQGARQEHLFDLAAINGLETTWQEWNGYGINLPGVDVDFGKVARQYIGCGSVLAFGPMDLGLPLREAPGKSEHFNLQLSIDYVNTSALTLNLDLFVVVVSQGIYSIYDGQASALLGILNENDILNTNKQAMHGMLSYDQVREVFAGSAAVDSMKGEVQAALCKAAPASNASKKSLKERLA